MSGWIAAVNKIKKIAEKYRRSRMDAMANRAQGVENELAVRYGSTIGRAVPATGRANRLAVKATPHHAAKFPAKHERAMRRQAQSKRNEVTIYHAKKARQGDR
jgi:hypothetical protein